MKTDFVGAVILFFIALFAYTKLVGPIPFSVNQTTTTKTDTFTVTGEGKVTVTPDIATINAGVTAQGTTVTQVQDQLNRTINAVTDAVKKAGVVPADIQTTNYNINPMYDYRNATPRITGYQANSAITIKVRKLDSANAVIDAATGAGANQVGGITFDVDDKTKAQNEARQKAVTEAKRKATDAARIAGFKLGRVINYAETFGREPQPVPMLAKSAGLGAGPETVPTQVQPGSTEIVVNVSLSFEID